MRWVLRIIGVLLALMGGGWMLQGLSLLPGTFMVGSTFWVWTGLLTLLVGLALLIIELRTRPPPPQ